MGTERPRGPRTGIEVDPDVLRRARLDSGLSLAEVAGTELTRQAVHLIETGKVRPTARSLRIIARRLGMPEAALRPAPGPESDERVMAELQQLGQRQEHALVAEQAQRLLALGGSDVRMAFAHHYAGQALYMLGRPSDALPHLREARARFEALCNPAWAAESLDWEAISLHMLEDARALRTGRTALRRYRAIEARRPETEARMLEHLGTICLGRRDYQAGRGWYEAALEVDGGITDLAHIARVYHGLGMCSHGLGRLRVAADLLFKAITLYEAEQRVASTPIRRGLPMAENDLGQIMLDQGDLDRAEELFLAALDHYAEIGLERLRSHTLLSLGELRQHQRRLDEALQLVTRAIELAASLDETFSLTAGYRQLGELHAERDEPQQADLAFQHALAICDEAGLEERAREYLRIYEGVLADRREARRRARPASA